MLAVQVKSSVQIRGKKDGSFERLTEALKEQKLVIKITTKQPHRGDLPWRAGRGTKVVLEIFAKIPCETTDIVQLRFAFRAFEGFGGRILFLLTFGLLWVIKQRF